MAEVEVNGSRSQTAAAPGPDPSSLSIDAVLTKMMGKPRKHEFTWG